MLQNHLIWLKGGGAALPTSSQHCPHLSLVESVQGQCVTSDNVTLDALTTQKSETETQIAGDVPWVFNTRDVEEEGRW